MLLQIGDDRLLSAELEKRPADNQTMRSKQRLDKQ